jgi:hypothetical protein
MKDMPQHPPETRATAHLHIETEDDERRLTNTSPVDVDRLVYSTCCVFFDSPNEGDFARTNVPIYEIEGLPSGCSITLEKIDPYEDGRPWFQINEVAWADGLKEEGVGLTSMSALLNMLAVQKRNERRLQIRAEMVAITRHLENKPVFLRALPPVSRHSGDKVDHEAPEN